MAMNRSKSNSDPNKHVKPHVGGRQNSIGLTRAELDLLHESMDREQSGKGAQRRESSRIAFHETPVAIDIVQPGGGQTSICVAARNLSRSGMGFLHSAYLHVGTTIVIFLDHRQTGPQKIRGTVVRCRHVTRHIHDIGIKFDKPINLRDFVQLDTLSQSFSCENVDPSKLKGVVLIIAEYRIETACVQSMLTETGMDFLTAQTIEEGLSQARKGVDIIVCDYQFDQGNGLDFLKSARQSGVRCPIIIMSADRSPEARDAIRKANAAGFLAKPLDKDTLMRALAEFLLVSGSRADSATVLYTSLPPNSPMRALANDFVNDLRVIGGEIEECAKAKDIAGIRKRCLRVAGPAPSLGFEPIAKLASSLITALDSTMSIDESIVPLNTFIQTCKSVRRAA